MKVTTKIYLDAALQNIKSVAFFTFLPVLIARLGASDFQIALSNSLPAIFCALSLAFLTRQLPVTRGIYLTSGYIRQFAFLCMALSILLPNPFPALFFFWSINAVSVIVTAAQQPAILRRVVEPAAFPGIFSRNKMIGIVILTIGSFTIGTLLDANDHLFPFNYVISMVIGCIATFGGMALIAGLAPREKVKFRFHWMPPFKECSRNTWWMALNHMGVAMMAPIYVIYHIKHLGLSNTQIAYFVIAAGIVSTVSLPFIRRLMERYGIRRIYGLALFGMALTIFPYGLIDSFWMLVIVQTWLGLSVAVNEVASQSIMMEEASRHSNEMAYFSDFQLVMHLGGAAGPMLTGALLAVLPLPVCFMVISALRMLFFFSRRLIAGPAALHEQQRPDAPSAM